MNRRRYGILGAAVLLAVFLLAALEAPGAEVKLWSDVADTSWLSQYAGTEEQPYRIDTAEQLAGLAKLVNGGTELKDKHILLTRDISVAGREWIPIGWGNRAGEEKGLRGVFDGGGHAVFDVTVSTKSGYAVGFFGRLPKEGTVKDLTLRGTIANVDGEPVGAVVGYSVGTILNCVTDCHVLARSANRGYAGGIIGLNNGGLARNCVSGGTVRSLSDSFTYAGGILGFSEWYKGALENCTAACSEVESEMDAGGIVGGFSPMPEIFKNCVSICDSVKGPLKGGIVGAYGYGWTDCYWLKVNENQPSVGLATAPGSEGMITDPSRLPVASVVLDATEVRTMLVGETRKIRARPYPSTGDLSGLRYRWSVAPGLTLLSGSEGPEIEVKAVSSGFYRVSLSVTGVLGVPADGGVPLTPGAVLKVADALPPATGIAVGGPSQALEEGESVVLVASTIPSDAAPMSLNWSVTKAEGEGASEGDLVLKDHGDGTATATLKKQRKGGASYTVTVRASTAAGTLSATATVWGAALDVEPNMPGFVPFGALLPDGAEGKRPFGVTSGLASSALAEIGANADDFRLGGDGLMYPSRALLETVMEALGKQENVKLSGGSPFPLVSLRLSKPRTLSAIGFWVEGKRFRASVPQNVSLFEARPGGTGDFFRYAKSPKDYLDGHFAVQREDGRLMGGDETFSPEEKYGLVVYVRDGGRFDLNPAEGKLAVTPVLSKSVAVSPDVSADISSDVSPDVSADLPKVPAQAVAPKLPAGTDARIGSVKPDLVFGDDPSDSLSRASKMLSECGLEEGDLVVDRKTGLVRLNPDVGWEIAEKMLGSGELIDEARALPVLSAKLPGGTSIAAVGFELSGSALMSGEASAVRLLKVTGPESGRPMEYAGSAEEFGDGRFTVLDGRGRIVEELNGRGRYVLTLFIEDGGEFDLDGRVDGRVVDPALLLSVERSSASSSPEIVLGPNGSGGSGCDAGFGCLLLLAFAGAVLRRRD